MKKIRYLGYRVTINYGSDQFCSLRENYVIAARALPDAGPEHLLFYTLNKVNNSMPKHNMYYIINFQSVKKITRIIRIKYISSTMRSLLVFLNTDNILSLLISQKEAEIFFICFFYIHVKCISLRNILCIIIHNYIHLYSEHEKTADKVAYISFRDKGIDIEIVCVCIFTKTF